MNIAVVVIGYDRPLSISRCLCRLSAAEYRRVHVDLIVSLDWSEKQSEILAMLRDYKWAHGDMIIRAFTNRQGLREHVLSCGDYTEKYDAVVVLEDDIVVSGSFFDYVLSALDFVGNDSRVAGVSLYSPSINEMAMLPFVPKRTGYDNFYLQSAQSWGQCWTRSMWRDFREWYDANCSKLSKASDMPSRIYSWPESSWKKYYMKYLVETGKTFLYPYDSFSSNYSDVGQHNKTVTPHFQVPMISGKSDFIFGGLNDVPCYDIFFERTELKYCGHDVCVDLYGTRSVSECRYFLSTQDLDFPVAASYGLTYRPHEDNFIKSSAGNDVFLYDLGDKKELGSKKKVSAYKLAKYHTNLSWRHSLIYGAVTLRNRVFKKLMRQ